MCILPECHTIVLLAVLLRSHTTKMIMKMHWKILPPSGRLVNNCGFPCPLVDVAHASTNTLTPVCKHAYNSCTYCRSRLSSAAVVPSSLSSFFTSGFRRFSFSAGHQPIPHSIFRDTNVASIALKLNRAVFQKNFFLFCLFVVLHKFIFFPQEEKCDYRVFFLF